MSLDEEMPILKKLFNDTPVLFFSDIVNKLQLLPGKRQVIQNIIVFCNLLSINLATSATSERSFSLARRATVTQKGFVSLVILDFHKHVTDRIDFVSVGNDFIAKHQEIILLLDILLLENSEKVTICLYVAYLLPCV